MTRYHLDEGPIVVGGVGGSGTRLVARILIELGFYLGADLNDELDNLWFTLLFKRRRFFVAASSARRREARRACAILGRALRGERLSDGDLRLVREVVADCPAAVGHEAHRLYMSNEWAQLRLESLRSAHRSAPSEAIGWGWKEPNSHVFLPELSSAFPAMRFVMVVRHGVDMAFSDNQQQLANWGERYGVAAAASASELPRQSLAFWVAANRRAIDWGEEHLQGRFLVLRYEHLCREPADAIADLADFIGFRPSPEVVARVQDIPSATASVARYGREDLSEFDAADLEGVRRLGFTV
jgi:hypothetical protein